MNNLKFYLNLLISIVISTLIYYPLYNEMILNLIIILWLISIIGIYTIIIAFIDPILYSIIFAWGYTLIYILSIDTKKAIKKPLYVFIAIIKRFINGFIEPLTSFGTITRCNVGKWYYYPLFIISRNPNLKK